MSLPESLLLGSAEAGIALTKSRPGVYVPTNFSIDQPIIASFGSNQKNGSASDWTIKVSEGRNSPYDVTEVNPSARKDREFTCWMRAVAPIGLASNGFFTQAEVSLRMRSLCQLLLASDTLDRVIRGEL